MSWLPQTDPLRAELTRRAFFSQTSAGLGAAALATLQANEVQGGASGGQGWSPRPASPRTQGKAGDLPVHVGRAEPDGHVGPQTDDGRLV